MKTERKEVTLYVTLYNLKHTYPEGRVVMEDKPPAYHMTQMQQRRLCEDPDTQVIACWEQKAYLEGPF
jgi:hypothetical protein